MKEEGLSVGENGGENERNDTPEVAHGLSESENLAFEKYKYKMECDMKIRIEKERIQVEIEKEIIQVEKERIQVETEKERIQVEEIHMKQMEVDSRGGTSNAAGGVDGRVHYIPKFTESGAEIFIMQFEKIATMKNWKKED